jgi:transposase
MPPHLYSEDLKARIPILHYIQHYTVKDICTILGVRKSLVYKTLSFHRLHGLTSNPFTRTHTAPRLLDQFDLEFIRILLARQPCIYLDEIQLELHQRRGIKASIPTISRTLRRMSVTHKAISVKALERNEMKRASYMNHIGLIAPDPNMLMFMDESAKDERTSGRRYGWSLVGTRCVQRRVFIRGKRYSILPVLTLDGIIAYDIIEGSVTSERFAQFLRDMVVCLFIPIHSNNSNSRFSCL